MTAITQKLVLDDVVKYLLHPAFNFEVVSAINNGKNALAIGDQLLGKIVWWTGSAWKILDEDDAISPVTTATYSAPDVTVVEPSTLGVITTLPRLEAVADADAAAFASDITILRRGPALVHRDGIDYGGADEDDVNAILKAQGIIIVDETGVAINYAVI